MMNGQLGSRTLKPLLGRYKDVVSNASMLHKLVTLFDVGCEELIVYEKDSGKVRRICMAYGIVCLVHSVEGAPLEKKQQRTPLKDQLRGNVFIYLGGKALLQKAMISFLHLGESQRHRVWEVVDGSSAPQGEAAANKRPRTDVTKDEDEKSRRWRLKKQDNMDNRCDSEC